MNIRGFVLEDAPLVNSMLQEEYGDAYPYLLGEQPPTKDILLVAEHDSEIVAFARASRIFNDVFEFGSLIIHPAHRGKGLAELMIQERLKRVALHGDRVTVITEPVCYRADKASQSNCVIHGRFKQMGIQPAKHPLIHPDLLGRQPESLTFAVRKDSEPFFQGRKLNLPARWHGIASSLCKEVLSGRLLDSTIPHTLIHSPNTVNGIKGSGFVDIPANWEASVALMEQYHAQGYRFSALLPRMGKIDDQTYDLVRLYRSGEKIDWSLIYVTPDLAPLKEFMRQEEQAKSHVFGAIR